MIVPSAVSERQYHSGSLIQACSGLRMNICKAPRTIATPKTAKASQKCARIRRRLFNTAQPRLRVGHLEEFGPVDHLDLGPHALMAHPAAFLTRHRMLAGS